MTQDSGTAGTGDYNIGPFRKLRRAVCPNGLKSLGDLLRELYLYCNRKLNLPGMYARGLELHLRGGRGWECGPQSWESFGQLCLRLSQGSTTICLPPPLRVQPQATEEKKQALLASSLEKN